MIEEILYEEQIAPPMPGAHLVEAFVYVVDRGVANIGIHEIHQSHDHQVEWTQAQVSVEEQLAKELEILLPAIATHCLQLDGVAQKVVSLQEATAESAKGISTDESEKN